MALAPIRKADYHCRILYSIDSIVNNSTTNAKIEILAFKSSGDFDPDSNEMHVIQTSAQIKWIMMLVCYELDGRNADFARFRNPL